MSTAAAPRRVFIETFGCQMNDYDSARMLRLLQLDGYAPTTDPAAADVVILNTCAVRDKAEQKALSSLGRHKFLREENPAVKFVLAGCFAQRAARKLWEKYPFIHLVLGTDAISRLPAHLRALEKGRGPIIDVEFAATYEEDVADFGDIFPGKGSPVAAFVTIMRGCNNFCAYCVVPYVRGRERSRPEGEIRREIEQLVGRGVREITLLGQNVNSYGLDLGQTEDFSGLLRRIHEIDGLARLRFTTSHPKDLSDRLIQCFADLPKLANHLHLPVQSGSDRILAAMRRGYDSAAYLRRIAALRQARPDIALTSDLLVGFPGETDADFRQTMALVEQIRYSNIFSFRYSVRPGTAASRLADDVPDKVKIARLEELQALQREITLAGHRELVGKEVVVLVEKCQQDGHRYPWSGKSGCYREIHFRGDGVAPGDMMRVKCTQAFTNHLLGESVGRLAPGR
ncbi:MAG: tRNA (N6-isopentenyl adenosine(37)-C2)-methylthiotransferase MiaB [Myxococcales bacterium]|nr:tRNA (N6-isopentenyl adenosine(37)-C2)-methylthiotransferase MiaB [Myxococcales bacterium]